ncbi:uncharacterized protein LOC143303080 isoform X2 [Bombus vancouverensis nearcticus]|uniref:uncharacterized protein LOC143303080 isoform X2 n=1 Tax=Bombus vancouverensis nearcticus TaxID=2705178 RepID=UPI00402B7385
MRRQLAVMLPADWGLTYHSFNFSVFFGNVLTVAQKPRTFPNNQQSFIVFCSAGTARQFDGVTLLFLCSS